MRKFSAVPLMVAAALVASSAFAADIPTCIRDGQHVLVQTRANAGDLPRVFFRSDLAKNESYVDMTAEGKTAWAVLPKPAAGTTSVAIRIATLKNGKYATTVERAVPVNATCNLQNFSSEQARATANIVVGETAAATLVPAGFRCDGIAANISADGVMTARNACAEVAAQTASEDKPGEATADAKAKATVASDETVGVTSHRVRPPRRGPRGPLPPNPRRPVSPARP